MTVLVTGGAGFIGSHLAAHLAWRGLDVRILDNFASGRRSNVQALPSDVELVEGDIQSYERVHNAVAGCDVVFHQAALPSVSRSVQDPLTSNAINVTGTLNVLLAARDARVRRVVFASSSSVYGATPSSPLRRMRRLIRRLRMPRQRWHARGTAAASARSTGSRPSCSATSTCSAPARIPARSTPR